MKLTNLIDEGNYYKGALHCHTVNSDGRLTPEELAAAYKALDYSFMAITDHLHYGSYPQFSSPDFLVLAGIELECDFGEYDQNYHILGIGQTGQDGFSHGEIVERFAYRGYDTALDMAKRLQGNHHLAIFAHPRWSLLNQADTGNFAGFNAVEIFNGLSYLEEGCGDSDQYYDMALFSGARLWCVATDDSHNFFPVSDLNIGWICVKAKELSEAEILKSIVEGSFYSSTGPEIKDFYIQDGVAHVSCSPCRSIHFMSWPFRGYSYVQKDSLLESAQWQCAPGIEYVRVVCVDEYGYKAWSNPIWLDGAGVLPPPAIV